MEDQWKVALDVWKKMVTELRIDTAGPYAPGYAITREDYDGR
jgi:hypothetical protein